MSQKPLSVLVVDENRVRALSIKNGAPSSGGATVTVITDLTGIAQRIVKIRPAFKKCRVPPPPACCRKFPTSARRGYRDRREDNLLRHHNQR